MEFSLTTLLQIAQFLAFIIGIIIAVRKINENQNLKIKDIEGYNDRQDDRMKVLEKDNEQIHIYISNLNESLNLIEKNSLKHIEKEMGEMKVEMTRIATVLKERLPSNNNGLKK